MRAFWAQRDSRCGVRQELPEPEEAALRQGSGACLPACSTGRRGAGSTLLAARRAPRQLPLQPPSGRAPALPRPAPRYLRSTKPPRRAVGDEWQGRCFQGTFGAGTCAAWRFSWLSPPSPAIDEACGEQQGGAARAGFPLGSAGHRAQRRLARCGRRPPLPLSAGLRRTASSSALRVGARAPRAAPPARGPSPGARRRGWPLLPGRAAEGGPPPRSPPQALPFGECSWMPTARPWHGHSRTFQSEEKWLKTLLALHALFPHSAQYSTAISQY